MTQLLDFVDKGIGSLSSDKASQTQSGRQKVNIFQNAQVAKRKKTAEDLKTKRKHGGAAGHKNTVDLGLICAAPALTVTISALFLWDTKRAEKKKKWKNRIDVA